MIISSVTGVNPLQTTLLELGIVSGRVALLLRSAEIQPVFDRFVIYIIRCISPPNPTFTIIRDYLLISPKVVVPPQVYFSENDVFIFLVSGQCLSC